MEKEMYIIAVLIFAIVITMFFIASQLADLDMIEITNQELEKNKFTEVEMTPYKRTASNGINK